MQYARRVRLQTAATGVPGACGLQVYTCCPLQVVHGAPQAEKSAQGQIWCRGRQESRRCCCFHQLPDELSRCRIVVSIPACHAGGRGSIPRSGDTSHVFLWMGGMCSNADPDSTLGCAPQRVVWKPFLHLHFSPWVDPFELQQGRLVRSLRLPTSPPQQHPPIHPLSSTNPCQAHPHCTCPAPAPHLSLIHISEPTRQP